MEIDSCNKIKRLSKENQAKTIILHESGTISKVIKEEKKSMISCWNEDIIGLETSKEVSGKQILLQRHDTTGLSIKLQIKTDLDNKLKVLSKERQDGSIRLNESRVKLATIAEEKDMTILCLNENSTVIETSKEVFQKQLLQKNDEITALSKTLKTEID